MSLIPDDGIDLAINDRIYGFTMYHDEICALSSAISARTGGLSHTVSLRNETSFELSLHGIARRTQDFDDKRTVSSGKVLTTGHVLSVDEGDCTNEPLLVKPRHGMIVELQCGHSNFDMLCSARQM